MLKRLLAAIEQAKREGRPLARIDIHRDDLAELEREEITPEALAASIEPGTGGALLRLAGVPVYPGPAVRGRPWCSYADGGGFVAPEIWTRTVTIGNGFLPDGSPRQRQAAAERILEAAGIKPSRNGGEVQLVRTPVEAPPVDAPNPAAVDGPYPRFLPGDTVRSRESVGPHWGLGVVNLVQGDLVEVKWSGAATRVSNARDLVLVKVDEVPEERRANWHRRRTAPAADAKESDAQKIAHTSISIVGDRIRIEIDGNEQDPARRARNERVLVELLGVKVG